MSSPTVRDVLERLALLEHRAAASAAAEPDRRRTNAERLRRVAAGIPARAAVPQDRPSNSEAAAPGRATASTTTTSASRLDGCC